MLVKNESGTFDLVWLRHSGRDVYLGFTSSPSHYSYHASGKRHQAFKDGRGILQEDHLPLAGFKEQAELATFGFSPRQKWGKVYDGDKADFVQILDSSSLPEYVNVTVGLIEAGKIENIRGFLAVRNPELLDIWSISLITSTKPWIYITVQSVKPELMEKAKILTKSKWSRNSRDSISI